MSQDQRYAAYLDERYDVHLEDQLESHRRDEIESLTAKVARLQSKVAVLHVLNGPSKIAGYWCSCRCAANLGGISTRPTSADYNDRPAWHARAKHAHSRHVAAETES